jgi:hypothetical protein
MIPRLPKGFTHPMLVGEGAFASVYRVRQDALGRWVALKLMYEKVPAKRQELLKEARTQAGLRVDCVPHLYDAFEWRSSVCMVMEFISGIPLAAALESPLTPDDRFSLAGSFITALAAIHNLGFVHRDLKPDNIIISPDRGLSLVDFGFTKKTAEANVSAASHAKGTPAFMAPELWRQGATVDLTRADVFSAGRILRILLAGTPASAFPDASVSEEPAARPASGSALRELWESTPWHRPSPPDWRRIAGDLTSERLSMGLLHASRQLIHAHRTDEAYWLLVESIETNGGNQEALELMAGFQQTAKKRFSRGRAAAVAAAAAIGLLASYFAGKHSTGSVAGESAVRRQHASLLATARPERLAKSPSAALREDSLQSDMLCGRLIVRSTLPKQTVRVDGRMVGRDSADGDGIRLHWGEHDVVVGDGSGRTFVHETVSLLPFQTKVVGAALPDAAPKGK